MRVGNATIKSDLEAYKYQFEANAMDNGYVDERNKCFCREGKYISNFFYRHSTMKNVFTHIISFDLHKIHFIFANLLIHTFMEYKL